MRSVSRACETRTRTCMKRSRCARPGRQGKLWAFVGILSFFFKKITNKKCFFNTYVDGLTKNVCLGALRSIFCPSKWHCCCEIPTASLMFQPNLSPLKSSYAQMRALLKIASNEFEMRFVVLGGLGQCET